MTVKFDIASSQINKTNMVEKMDWSVLEDTGLLVHINLSLQMFGMAIMLNKDQNGKVISADLIRTAYRGMPQDKIIASYEKISDFMQKNAGVLKRDLDL